MTKYIVRDPKLHPENSNTPLIGAIGRMTRQIEDYQREMRTTHINYKKTTDPNKYFFRYANRFTPKGLLMQVVSQSPLLVMAKKIHDDVRDELRNQKTIEQKMMAKEQKAKDKEQKKSETDKKSLNNKSQKNIVRDRSSSSTVQRVQSKIPSIVNNDAALLEKYPQLASIISNEDKDREDVSLLINSDLLTEEQKQTELISNIYKEMTSDNKSDAKTVRKTKEEKDKDRRDQERSLFFSEKASNQKRDSKGRFRKTTKLEKLMEKLITVMEIQGTLSALKGSLSSIFSPSKKGLLGFIMALGGLAIRFSALGFLLVAGAVGIFKAVEAWIDPNNKTLADKLKASATAFLYGIGEVVDGILRMTFGDEVVDKWAKKMNDMVDKFLKLWNFDFDGFFSSIKKRLDDYTWTVPYTGIKVHPLRGAFDVASSSAKTVMSEPVTFGLKGFVTKGYEAGKKYAESREGLAVPNNKNTTATITKGEKDSVADKALNMVTMGTWSIIKDQAPALNRARKLNKDSQEAKELERQQLMKPQPTGNSVVTAVNTNITNGTAIGFPSNIRNSDNTISKMLGY